MSSNESSAMSPDNRVKELHTNVRHITQLAMNWFAFFVTVNYLTMGWLAKSPSSGGENINPNIIKLLASVFIVQNLLGIFGLTWVLRAAATMKGEVSKYENPQKEKRINESIPINLYVGIGVFLMFVLGSLILAWAIIL